MEKTAKHHQKQQISPRQAQKDSVLSQTEPTKNYNAQTSIEVAKTKDAILLAEPTEGDYALSPIIEAMMHAIKEDRDIVFVCFGTMAISGDSLGPQVGTLLTQKYNIPAFVYGTEDCAVNGKNMKEWLPFIKAVHKDSLIIAIDASLGAKTKVGQIVFRTDGVCPAGVKGNENRFGDIGILGVVAQNSTDPLMQLMTVSPLYVSNMADKISIIINEIIY